MVATNSVDVKNQLIQKVMANNKLKQKLQQQSKLEAANTSVEPIAGDKIDDVDATTTSKTNADSFVVTPDYIQQSNF